MTERNTSKGRFVMGKRKIKGFDSKQPHNAPSEKNIVKNSDVGENAVSSLDSEKEIFSMPLLQSILGTTAFISALLFSIGWIYNRRYFEVFGIHGYTIRYPAQDYILNAKSVLSICILVAFVLLVIFIHPVVITRKFRLTVSISCYIVLVFIGVYFVRDVWVRIVTFGLNVSTYSTKWATLMLAIALLLYGAIAPTYLFKRATSSQQYHRFSRFISWSGLVAVVTLMVLLVSNYIGALEGKLDASVNSRLLSINIAVDRPLGFGITPDSIITKQGQQPLYVYRNLRYLTQFEGSLYVFRPEKDVVLPMVHVIPLDKGYIISVGSNPQNADPLFTN